MNLNQFAQPISSVLVDATLKSLVVLLLALVVLWIFKVQRSRSYVHDAHRVWMMVIVSVIALPFLTLVAPRLSVPIASWVPSDLTIENDSSKPGSGAGFEERNANGFELDASANQDSWKAGDANNLTMNTEEFNDLSLGAPSTIPVVEFNSTSKRKSQIANVESDHAFPVFVIGFFVWLIGTLFFGAKLTVAIFRTRQIVLGAKPIVLPNQRSGTGNSGSFAIPNKTVVLESSDVASPVVTGWISFKILLPTQWTRWTTEKLTAVLAHELAHVRRRDGLVSLLSELATVIFWFNPVSWIAKTQISRFAELSCDQAAAISTGNRFEYASLLLEVAAARQKDSVGFEPGIAMASKSEIAKRVEQLLDTSRPLRIRASKICWAILILMGLPAVLLVAAAQPGLPNQDPDSPVSKIDLDNRDHIRMEGDRLYMRFCGEVFMPNGDHWIGFRL